MTVAEDRRPRASLANSRALLLLIIAGIALLSTALTLPSVFSAHGAFGWNVAPDGVTVISVTRGFPAQRAGIRPGDRIVYRTLPLRGRYNTIFAIPLAPGERLSFEIEHSGVSRPVTLQARALPVGLTGLSVGIGLLSNLVALGVGIALVALRPGIMTWAFLLYTITALVPFSEDPAAAKDDLRIGAILFANGALSGITTAAAFVFAGRFPRDEPRRWTLWLDRLAIPWILATVAIEAYAMWAITSSPVPPNAVAMLAEQYGFPAFGTAIVLAALAAAYASASGALRHRIFPVLAVFALATVFNFVWTLANGLTTGPYSVPTVALAAQILNLAFPLSVAYAVVRHRVIDVRFVVSRTLVYSTLTAAIVGTFALVHYLVGKLLERTQLALLIELVIAIAYGVWLDRLNERLDRWVDRLLFRRRHRAEQRLERVARALPQATSEDFVEEMLAVEAADAFGLASAAVFRREPDGSFRRRSSVGWSDREAPMLSAEDRLVVLMRASSAPLDLAASHWAARDLPSGVAQPLDAIPVTVQNDVYAIVLYGSHVEGEALDPDELRVLRALAAAAASAYDHVAVTRLQAQVAALQNENAGLREAQAALADATRALHDEVTMLARLRTDGS